MITEFQEKVYRAISMIPEGRVTTYGAIASYIGTGGVRAVGRAVGKNPYAPEVPCHRVVYSNARVGNYSAQGGVREKIRLLESEKVKIEDGVVLDFEKIFFDYGSTDMVAE